MLLICRFFVGVRRLELPTSTSRTWRANQLCYTPSAVSECKGTQSLPKTSDSFANFFEQIKILSKKECKNLAVKSKSSTFVR